MTLPTDEVVDRLEAGMDAAYQFEDIIWPAVEELTNKIIESPITWIIALLIFIFICRRIIKRR